MLAEGPACAYCVTVRADTVDHVHPLSRAHERRDERLPLYLPACRACNTAKADRSLAEWVATGRAPAGARAILRQHTVQ